MLIALLLFVLILNNAQSAKILGIFPVPAPSHYILGSALMKGLAEKGHDVTFISPYREKNPPKTGSYRDITLTRFVEESERRRKEMNMFEKENMNGFITAAMMSSMLTQLSELTLNHSNVQQLLNSDEKFDVVIVEQFLNEAHKAFATHFKAPLILFSTVGASAWVNLLVGNPAPPSYVPSLLLSYSCNMTFTERVVNSLMHLFTECLHNFYLNPKQDQLIKKYFPNGPNLNDVLYNASIVLMNSHPSTNQAVPYVPNMIDIGGFHVKTPKPLPKDLQNFLDSGKDGVIYFSLGSNLKSSDLPLVKRQAFLNTFSKLKQKILWKWEEDVLPSQPSNVKLGKWLPQQDILAHPNVKLFITHGGLLSITETIYHGVPVLAIPIFGDQKLNAHRIVNEGFGLSLSYKEITEEKLSEKLTQLLTNSAYSNEAKKKSRIFHDRLVSPMDTAIYWVEYVIRHKGASHLRVTALDLPWYKYHLLDVICFVFMLSLFVLYCVYKEFCQCQLVVIISFERGRDITVISPYVCFTKWMFQMIEKTLSHTNVQRLIYSGEEFDVVIVEEFNNEAHEAFATRFKAPLVLFTTITVPFVPNVINTGGFHIQPPRKLSNDLQEFLDNANDGLSNARLGKWFPQQDILVPGPSNYILGSILIR
ncbi:UDPGT and/or Glyco tran 28 C domain containing protein, partial [Asbolus verrucosus]